MNLIKVANVDGDIVYVNPRYVRTFKGTRSEYNNDWCIVIDLISDKHTNDVYTILFDNKEMYEKKLNEIINVMESIQ